MRRELLGYSVYSPQAYLLTPTGLVIGLQHEPEIPDLDRRLQLLKRGRLTEGERLPPPIWKPRPTGIRAQMGPHIIGYARQLSPARQAVLGFFPGQQRGLPAPRRCEQQLGIADASLEHLNVLPFAFELVGDEFIVRDVVEAAAWILRLKKPRSCFCVSAICSRYPTI